ncbi:MAG: DUF1214 domain-containing protein [Proteobacteria bacterium]|nr:DUF1214 domain-containing protein [Pseudomonadota bacterium]HQR04879.1 hypothetical protein [Rhodocyclaceae bacterium]
MKPVLQIIRTCFVELETPRRLLRGAGLAIVALSMLSLPAQAGEAGAREAGALTERSAVIDWKSQIAFDRHSLHIMEQPAMRKAIHDATVTYASHPLARYRDGGKTLANAVEAIALTAANYALADPDAPAIVWSANAAHHYGRLMVRGSGYGVDNPDNFYRMFAVDGDKRYEIHGHRNHPGPAMEMFLLYEAIPGTTAMNAEGAKVLAALAADSLQTGPDGNFVITIDSDPANGRKNHIQTPVTARRLHVVVRDTLVDWGTEIPNPLRIGRTDPVIPHTARSDAQIAEDAAAILKKITPFWLEYFDQRTYNSPANSVKPLWARAGGWGYASGGWFNLQDDEALVLTLAPLGARYLGFQIADVWGVAPEYTRHTSSLTQKQVKPNDDGTITYVISAQDPGVWNWLDTVGLHTGLFAIRWQGLRPTDEQVRTAILGVRVVKMANLKDALPSPAVPVTGREREQQQAARAKAYQTRLQGIPVRE